MLRRNTKTYFICESGVKAELWAAQQHKRISWRQIRRHKSR